MLALANVAEDMCRKLDVGADELGWMSPAKWRDLATIAGHPSRKAPSPATRAAVIDKVRADLAAPYRAKGRG